MKKFSEVVNDLDESRLASNRQNLANAILMLDEGKKHHLQVLREIATLREEIIAVGDNVEACADLKTIGRLYDRARKIGGAP
jgi:hypothetical protein